MTDTATGSDIPLKPVGASAPVRQRALYPVTRISRHHALLSFFWAGVAIAAAVGLGQGDWYVRQMTDYAGDYTTFYYGLTQRVTCLWPAVPGGAGNTQSYGNNALFPCQGIVQQQYAALSLADNTQDERNAFDRLIGAGDIIIVVLSFAILFAGLAAVINLQYTFQNEEYAVDRITEERHKHGAQIFGFLAFVSELLAIVFWITIFPYSFARSIEIETDYVKFANEPGFLAYLTIGTALAIQIAGVITALLALIFSYVGVGLPTNLPKIETRAAV